MKLHEIHVASIIGYWDCDGSKVDDVLSISDHQQHDILYILHTQSIPAYTVYSAYTFYPCM